MMHEVLLLSVCPAVARRARRNVDPDSVITIRARPIYTNHTSTPAQGDQKTTVSVSREIQCCQQRLEKTYVIRTRQDIRNLLILSGTLNLSGVQSARANPPPNPPRVLGRPYDGSHNPMQGSLPQGKAEKGTVPDP